MTTDIESPTKEENVSAEVENTIEKGDEVRFSVGFDHAKLDALLPENLVDERSYDVEERRARVVELIELYKRLPEQLTLEPGITAIFGDNGKGKTLLADVIIMAVKMQLHRQENGIGRDVDLSAERSGFYTGLPGRLVGNGMATNTQEMEDSHRKFVAQIADCMSVYKGTTLTLDGSEFGFDNALRTPVALGNAAIGMSSRQTIEYMAQNNARINKNDRASIFLYDEPELGMSPRRQRGLIEELHGRVDNKVVTVMPTNSIVVFESSLPRIDLDEPERGVFTPEVDS